MAQIVLSLPTSSLEIKLSTAVTNSQVGWSVERSDDNMWSITTWSASGSTNNTTAVTMVPAPTAPIVRTIKAISIYNNDTSEATINISRNDNWTKKVVMRKKFPSLLAFSTGDWQNIVWGNVIWATSSTDWHFVVFKWTSWKEIKDGWPIPTGLPWFLETFCFAISDEVIDIATGTGKVYFRVPYDSFIITKVKASLNTASSSWLPTFDININWTSILSTKLTIDANEKTSETAATPPVLSTSIITADQELSVDIDVAGTWAKWAKIYIIGHQ